MVARRPTIRPRAVTPPRAADRVETLPAPRKLPPVRTPAPRAPLVEMRREQTEPAEAARPVLLLVADASDQFDIALRYERAVAGAFGHHAARRVPTALLVAIAIATSIVVVAVAALVTSRITEAPSFTPMPATATKITTTTAATMTAAATRSPATPVTPVVAEAPIVADVPVVDVKNLPAARSR